MANPKLRLAILDSPYEIWNEPGVQELFGKAVALKELGYREAYPKGVLPVDTSDFVGTHHLLCEESGQGELRPLLAYRTITWTRARRFNLPFSGLALVRAAGSPDYVKAVEKILAACEREGLEISYDGSWTIDPGARRDRELTARLRDTMRGTHYLFHTEYGIPQSVGGGVLRFKTEKYFYSFGYEPIREGDREIEPFLNPYLGNEPVVFMHLKRYAPSMAKDAEAFRRIWEQRLTLESPECREERERARAPRKKAA